MKKFFLGLIVITSATFAKAQTVSLGPTAGFGHASITNIDNADHKFKPAWNAGLSATYSWNSGFGIGADLKASGEGVKLENGTTTQTLNANYIRVPLKAMWFFGEYGQAVRPKIYLGPSFGFLIGGETTTTVSGVKTITQTKDRLNSFDFGVQAGVGINFRVSPNTWLNTDLSYYHGITDINKTAQSQKNHNMNVGINVGLLFGIGTK